MNQKNKQDKPQIRFGPIQWLNNPLRTSIKQSVSNYIEYKWIIKDEKDLAEFACHPCAILSDGSFAIFVKYSVSADAKQQFEVELSNLLILSRRAEVLVPQPIGIIDVENGTILIMEALESIQREPRQWRQIGTTLARIHQVKSEMCGFDTNGFWGPLHQDNTPTQDWMTFYRERRLLPLFKTAIDSGNIPSSVASQVEKLISRLPELCGPQVAPSLLHGDAQKNNFISTAQGTYVIDPAIFYGNPEWDLALVDSFQPVPDDVFDAYRDEMPMDRGFAERRDLWRVPLYLAAVAIEGQMHLNKLTNTLKKYV
jgi:protein-ribulosamine 3-kinase